MMKFAVKHLNDEVAIVEFELEGAIEPTILQELTPPDAVSGNFASKVVILSGRGPIWLYGFLIHFYHPVKAIGVFDPRLNGAVIVASHVRDVKVGDVIKVN